MTERIDFSTHFYFLGISYANEVVKHSDRRAGLSFLKVWGSWTVRPSRP